MPSSIPDAPTSSEARHASVSRSMALRRLVGDVASCLRAHDLWFYAAGLTFYTLIAAVPLLVLCLAFAGLVVGPGSVENLAEQLIAYLPEGTRDIVATGVIREMDMALGGAAFVAALIPASSYGEGLSRAFNRFSTGSQPHRAARGRLLSLVLLLALQVATLGVLAAVDRVPQMLGLGLGAQALGSYLTFLVGWGLSTAVIAVMYSLFTPQALGYASTLWAAAAAGSFFTGMSMGWLLALRFGVDVGLAYGGSEVVGTLVLAALYFYFVQIVVLVGYVLALELAKRGGNPMRTPD